MRIETTDPKTAAAVWAALGQPKDTAPPSLVVVVAERTAPRPCSCGCGGLTGGGLWLPGHDAKHKSALDGLVRAGGAEGRRALAELATRGWPAPAAKKAKTAKADPSAKAAVAKAEPDSTDERTAAREAAAAAV